MTNEKSNDSKKPVEKKQIAKAYEKYTEQFTPKPKYFLNSLKAFVIGGLICAGSLWLENSFVAAGLSEKAAGTYVVILLVMLAQLLTGLGCFDTLGKFAGAGVIVPITGFANSMVAPAAVDTILNHLQDTGRDLEYYDALFTGDLGFIGKSIVEDLLLGAGVNARALETVYDDCGTMIYEKKQDVHSGGSGCGCSASTFAGYVYKKMRRGEMNRVLIMSTGALLSTISPFQGESIPGIAHAISLEAE